MEQVHRQGVLLRSRELLRAPLQLLAANRNALAQSFRELVLRGLIGAAAPGSEPQPSEPSGRAHSAL